MIEKRFEYNQEKGYNDYIYDVTDNRMMWDLECICELLNSLNDDNKQLKQQINTIINELQAEKETAISRNERIRLDFAITVLEELKGD